MFFVYFLRYDISNNIFLVKTNNIHSGLVFEMKASSSLISLFLAYVSLGGYRIFVENALSMKSGTCRTFNGTCVDSQQINNRKS